MPLRLLTLIVATLLGTALLAIWWQADLTWARAVQFFPVLFVGIGGATIANASGVGGGVVFVPVFDYFNSAGIVPVTATQIVATSFLIQCFGMTTGSLTWLNKMRHQGPQPATGIATRDFWQIICWVVAGCLPALLATQYIFAFTPADVLFWFKSLSICLGCALLMSVWRDNPNKRPRYSLAQIDLLVLAALGVIGGFATALFSVGVGELVALYLFIRNYPLVTCAATAVIITAITVLTGLVYHLLHTDIPWQLAAFAIPGAVIGGYIARGFAYFLGPHRLKILAGLWIVGSSVYLLAAH
ncbi:sulfite exporter TauE/SafE family protein [Simiduia aestuariiviva]|uniref:Probable membrane transporter protein n=1 Tax=Simiduia aestuariiviva TaxID=1510459 RepID=A0A839UUD0_9GAMM|nr:sulfite exporter TauE/SafE family protein [Simiduia aestuariiviva]MBB3169586.1 putative membrane protein YfcA [Simiduia aestuariiviva]